jgi:hypothetical protein
LEEAFLIVPYESMMEIIVASTLIQDCCVTIAKHSMLTLTRVVRSNLFESFDEYVIGYFRRS